MKIFYDYHTKKYPLINKEDKIKLIYQGTLGPNHLGKNLQPEDVKQRVQKELLELSNPIENLYEWISENFIRINIHKYVENSFSLDYLINSFISSAKQVPYSMETLKKELLKHLNSDELKDYDYQPISHSHIYRNTYLPHYLVISKDFLTIDLRIRQLDNFLEQTKDYSITSLDGKCASGKTTITRELNNKYTIINIDDFFLSNEKKTPKRLNEIGGNIDYELVKENLTKIKDAYSKNQVKVLLKCFDCQKQAYYNKEITLKKKTIIEGVYSNHSYFKELIDYNTYLYVDDETQLKRVLNRTLKDRFINEWIPLENKYFDYYQLEDHCNLII